MKRGFTLIEILVVVAIMGLMMAGALVTLASGRSAAHAKEASRGVSQMSHYAAALALLRQRRVVVEYRENTISVKISGKPLDLSDLGSPAEPIYREVDGQDIEWNGAASAENAQEPSTDVDSAAGAEKERRGYLFTRRVLDPEELAKENADRAFEDVVFELELLDDDAAPLEEEESARQRNYADTVAQTCVEGASAKTDAQGEPETNVRDARRGGETKPQRVVFETNGNCMPHRVAIREAVRDEDGNLVVRDGPELMTLTVSRSGKVTVSDEDEDDRSRTTRRRRSRR